MHKGLKLQSWMTSHRSSKKFWDAPYRLIAGTFDGFCQATPSRTRCGTKSGDRKSDGTKGDVLFVSSGNPR